MGHTITSVIDQDSESWTVEYFDDEDTERVRGYGVRIPHAAVHSRMAIYGIESPDEALSYLIHEYHWGIIRPDRRDDPAVEQGWVTTTTPDAEPVHIFNARSGRDVAGAHRARWDACAAVLQLQDPDGLLPDPEPDPAAVRRHREEIDTLRWVEVYGDLPEPPLTQTRTPVPQDGAGQTIGGRYA